MNLGIWIFLIETLFHGEPVIKNSLYQNFFATSYTYVETERVF